MEPSKIVISPSGMTVVCVSSASAMSRVVAYVSSMNLSGLVVVDATLSGVLVSEAGMFGVLEAENANEVKKTVCGLTRAVDCPFTYITSVVSTLSVARRSFNLEGRPCLVLLHTFDLPAGHDSWLGILLRVAPKLVLTDSALFLNRLEKQNIADPFEGTSISYGIQERQSRGAFEVVNISAHQPRDVHPTRNKESASVEESVSVEESMDDSSETDDAEMRDAARIQGDKVSECKIHSLPSHGLQVVRRRLSDVQVRFVGPSLPWTQWGASRQVLPSDSDFLIDNLVYLTADDAAGALICPAIVSRVHHANDLIGFYVLIETATNIPRSFVIHRSRYLSNWKSVSLPKLDSEADSALLLGLKTASTRLNVRRG